MPSLEEGANGADIAARFKRPVKRHHDPNGGDTPSEDEPREIIEAYNGLEKTNAGADRTMIPGS